MPPRPGYPSGSWRAAPRAAWPRARPVVPRLVVPAYFHPAAAPGEWARLARDVDQIRMVVLNPASGPGRRPDPAYLDVLAPLQAAGVQIAAYVDSGYGRRPWRDALADIGRYQDWYPVNGVLFDQVSAGPEDLRHYAQLSRRARKAGMQVVAFNHGVHPHEGYARHADVLGTFEGPWNTYLQQGMPKWTRRWPADRFYHVVYSVPPQHLADAFVMAGRRRAGCVYLTDHGGSNPYDRLPGPAPAPATGQARR